MFWVHILGRANGFDSKGLIHLLGITGKRFVGSLSVFIAVCLTFITNDLWKKGRNNIHLIHWLRAFSSGLSTGIITLLCIWFH
ncbi:MAG TPA: hypothetical protein VKA34_21585 [Balneolales bacterium]|nr:hypothetical protein [Balneolales bacterium]